MSVFRDVSCKHGQGKTADKRCGLTPPHPSLKHTFLTVVLWRGTDCSSSIITCIYTNKLHNRIIIVSKIISILTDFYRRSVITLFLSRVSESEVSQLLKNRPTAHIPVASQPHKGLCLHNLFP